MARAHPSITVRRSLFLITCVAPAWAGVVALTGGIGWRAGNWNLASHDPLRPLILGAAAAIGYFWLFSKQEIAQDDGWLAQGLKTLSAPGALILSAAILLAGVLWGTFAASGSDAYGYVSQADLWLRGALRVSQPWVPDMAWPLADWTFTPLGYRPATVPNAIVPVYAPGLPLLMAGFKIILGARGPFFVVPALGALAVWLTYLLGRDATGESRAGLLAALLLATSPIFLFQLMWPMSDVPVTAWWTLTFWLALRSKRPRPLAAGFAASAAVLTRPYLAPVAIVLTVVWLWLILRWPDARRDAWRAMRYFVVGLAPGVAATAALNAYLFGSPVTSGYGDLDSLYSTANVLTNARHYGAWLVDTQTPLVVVGVLGLILPGLLRRDEHRASRRLAFAGAIGFVVLSYLLYGPFEEWWYLRFLLPIFPLLFVLVAAALVWAWRRVPVPFRVPLAFMVFLPLAAYEVKLAVDRQAFDLKTFEQRYVTAANYVAGATPSNAMILSMQHGGSLRYYARRITLRYDLLQADWLDRAVEIARSKGFHPYIVLEDWEEPIFRERFGRLSELGRLDWKPMADLPGAVHVRVYDSDHQLAASPPPTR